MTAYRCKTSFEIARMNLFGEPIEGLTFKVNEGEVFELSDPAVFGSDHRLINERGFIEICERGSEISSKQKLNRKVMKMIDKNRSWASCVGKMATTTQEIKNGWGMIPAGALVKITSSNPYGMEIQTEPCACCGARMRVSNVKHADLTLVEEGPFAYRIRVDKSSLYCGEGEGDEVDGMTFDTIAQARKALKEHGWKHRYHGEYDRGNKYEERGKSAWIDEIALSAKEKEDNDG